MLHQAALMILISVGFVFTAFTIMAGLVALISPKSFAQVAGFWSTWVETKPRVPIADHRIDIDAFVLRFPRALGMFVLASGVYWLVVLLQAV